MNPAKTASTTFEESVDKTGLTASAPDCSVPTSARKYSVQGTLGCVEFKQRTIQPLQRQRNRAAAGVQFRFAPRGVKCGRYRAGGLHVACERSGFSRGMTVHIRVRAKAL